MGLLWITDYEYGLYQSLVSICVPPSVLVALYVVNYVVINVLELPGTTLQLHHVEIDVVNDVLEGGENSGDESQSWSESKALISTKSKGGDKGGPTPTRSSADSACIFFAGFMYANPNFEELNARDLSGHRLTSSQQKPSWTHPDRMPSLCSSAPPLLADSSDLAFFNFLEIFSSFLSFLSSPSLGSCLGVLIQGPMFRA